ncbi:hypothetical protein AYO21_07261 [Fonsecaea monophora]|uniref:Heterokaryon incompatibility domain-containing protein n=1 Tax=Fonsecaea monophora TaxID=254056 RepID=A0A177F583_9EURO|nr:hypothetical protein AYO21_07261 [Fonsecaea monophora]OAG38439.1 hypothetical protein AYO21_07261 [Fonsecaea monophora]
MARTRDERLPWSPYQGVRELTSLETEQENIELECLPAFQHMPLDLARKSIRLLTVLPRRTGGRICGQLSQHCLPDNGSDINYVALSYEWGNRSGPRRLIKINGAKFEIQENLFHFLESHGDAGIPNLWVDAICIDQDDVREKNHQVQLMKDIYGKSSAVTIWLGLGNPESDSLFDFLNGVPEQEPQCASLSQPPLLEAPKKSKTEQQFLNAGAKCSQAAYQLCQRTYWSRAWIVQEALLACSLELVCGNKRVSWTTWARYIDLVGNIPEDTMDPLYWPHRGFTLGIRYSMAFTLCQQRIARLGTIAMEDLALLVLAFAESECWDIHDKVYAFLGLASNGKKIAVNYQWPMEGLFVAVLATTSATLSDHEISTLRTTLGVASTFIARGLRLDTDAPLEFPVPVEETVPVWKAKLKYKRTTYSLSSKISLRFDERVWGEAQKNTPRVCECPSCKAWAINYHQRLIDLHQGRKLLLLALPVKEDDKHQTYLLLDGDGEYVATGTLQILGGATNSFWSDMIILYDPPMSINIRPEVQDSVLAALRLNNVLPSEASAVLGIMKD